MKYGWQYLKANLLEWDIRPLGGFLLMPLEEIPIFHLYSDLNGKPLKKEERAALLAELRKKLEEVKEIKRQLQRVDKESTVSQEKKETAPEKSVQDLVNALEELKVPALELLKDKSSHKPLTA